MATTPGDPAQRIQKLEAENRVLKDEVRRLRDENRRWARMAGTDALTGLPNKIFFARALVPQALQRAASERRPVGFILLSADEVGEINQARGRDAGDEVIRGLANLLQSILGDEHRLGHLDGTNFAVILYPADPDHVRSRANMLRARIRAHAFPCADTTASITISAGGVSIVPAEKIEGRTLGEALFRRLNQALYDAKKGGGDRVEVIQHNATSGKEPSQ